MDRFFKSNTPNRGITGSRNSMNVFKLHNVRATTIFKSSVDEEQSCLFRIGFHDPNGPQTFVRKRPRISGGGKKKKKKLRRTVCGSIWPLCGAQRKRNLASGCLLWSSGGSDHSGDGKISVSIAWYDLVHKVGDGSNKYSTIQHGHANNSPSPTNPHHVHPTSCSAPLFPSRKACTLPWFTGHRPLRIISLAFVPCMHLCIPITRSTTDGIKYEIYALDNTVYRIKFKIEDNIWEGTALAFIETLACSI